VAQLLADEMAVECVGWMTHLACADDVDNAMTARQLATFAQATQHVRGARSVANSAGGIAWPAAHADVVRPGIMLYGSSPMATQCPAELDSQPVLQLTAPWISRRHVPAHEPVGCGATWTTSEAMDVGIVGVRYSDGYPRHAPSGTPVLLGGQRVPLIGRISMD